MNEYPNIRPGGDIADTSARQWRKLMEEHKAMFRTVFGENGQRIASGITVTPQRVASITRPPSRDVVIVRKPIAGDKVLLVREARYKDLPPKPCTGEGDNATCFYEWFGTDFEAYAPLGVKPIDYDGDEWDGDTDPELDTVFHECQLRHESWILQPRGKGGDEDSYGIILSASNGGTDPSNAEFIRIARMKPGVGGIGITYATPKDGSPFYQYELVACWPRTDWSFWREFRAANINQPDAVGNPLVLLVMVGGVEYAHPTFAINTFVPSPTLPRGGCG